jgi:hypothetical protein
MIDRAWLTDPWPAIGVQRRVDWAAGDVRPVQIVDKTPGPSLWRVSVVGDVRLRCSFGSGPGRVLELDAPAELTLPGQLAIQATPRLAVATVAIVTLTLATADGRCWARTLETADLAGTPLPDSAGALTALTALALLVRGVAVALVAGDQIPVVTGTVITAGHAIVEHVL